MSTEEKDHLAQNLSEVSKHSQSSVAWRIVTRIRFHLGVVGEVAPTKGGG